jgi:hypothetical protein
VAGADHLAGRLKSGFVDQFLQLVHCRSRGEVRVIVVAHWTNPDLEDLLRPRQIGVRMKLEVAARKILGVRIVDVVHAALNGLRVIVVKTDHLDIYPSGFRPTAVRRTVRTQRR